MDTTLFSRGRSVPRSASRASVPARSRVRHATARNVWRGWLVAPFSLALCSLFAFGDARADAQLLLPFQGILRTSTGAVITAPTTVTFSLFTESEGGTAIWAETLTLTPESGVVSATLGESEAISADAIANLDIFLGVRVDGESEMVPRIRLGSSVNAAFAFKALQADSAAEAAHATTAGDAETVDGVSAESFAPAEHAHRLEQLEDVSVQTATDGQILTFQSGTWIPRTPADGGGKDLDWRIEGENLIAIPPGSVGIGTDFPEAKLHVEGDLKALIIHAETIESFAPDGTPPFLVNSLTRVDGLNAELLDGHGVDDFALTDHTHELANLSDVGFGDLTDGQVLVRKGDVWTNDDVPSELGEIDLTDPTGGNVLLYDGTAWINGYVSSDELEDQVRFGDGSTPGRVDIFAPQQGINVVELNREAAGSGRVEVFNKHGESVIRAHADPEGVDGALVVEGFHQVKNLATDDTRIQLATANNAGVVSVLNASNVVIAGIDGQTGNVFGTTKSFLVPDPTDSRRLIKYTSIEGPEAGIYARGHAELVGGLATILLPEHFSTLVDPESMTVSLTPRSASSLGLAAIRVSGTEITIAELQHGTGAYAFDYLVQGTRKGFEDYEVYVPVSSRDAFAPRASDH